MHLNNYIDNVFFININLSQYLLNKNYVNVFPTYNMRMSTIIICFLTFSCDVFVHVYRRRFSPCLLNKV